MCVDSVRALQKAGVSQVNTKRSAIRSSLRINFQLLIVRATSRKLNICIAELTCALSLAYVVILWMFELEHGHRCSHNLDVNNMKQLRGDAPRQKVCHFGALYFELAAVSSHPATQRHRATARNYIVPYMPYSNGYTSTHHFALPPWRL